MPHQPSKDAKGQPQEEGVAQPESRRQTAGAANTASQRAYNQQGGASGTVDQASEREEPTLQPESTARKEGDLRQTRVYEDDS